MQTTAFLVAVLSVEFEVVGPAPRLAEFVEQRAAETTGERPTPVLQQEELCLVVIDSVEPLDQRPVIQVGGQRIVSQASPDALVTREVTALITRSKDR